MAANRDILALLGEGYAYNGRTRGFDAPPGSGLPNISRRRADVEYGRLRAQGIRSPEAQAKMRRELGIAPGPARGRAGQRLLRLFPVIAYDPTAPAGVRRIEQVAADKRAASLLGDYWSRVQPETALGLGDPAAFKRRFDRRVIRDIRTGARYLLIGDLDLLLRFYDTLTDEEQAELWEMLYEKRWSAVA